MAKTMYDVLFPLFSEAHFAGITYKKGSNKKKREDAGKELYRIAFRTKYHLLEENETVKKLFLEGDGELYDRSTFFSVDYFADGIDKFIGHYGEQLKAIPAP